MEKILRLRRKKISTHVGKRMGKRLRDKKKELSRTHLSDGKTIGGKGRLTGAVIDMLSKYYGLRVKYERAFIKRAGLIGSGRSLAKQAGGHALSRKRLVINHGSGCQAARALALYRLRAPTARWQIPFTRVGEKKQQQHSTVTSEQKSTSAVVSLIRDILDRLGSFLKSDAFSGHMHAHPACDCSSDKGLVLSASLDLILQLRHRFLSLDMYAKRTRLTTRARIRVMSVELPHVVARGETAAAEEEGQEAARSFYETPRRICIVARFTSPPNIHPPLLLLWRETSNGTAATASTQSYNTHQITRGPQ
ncbi:unnamed protein product, partial [Trichogramma brassicae]